MDASWLTVLACPWCVSRPEAPPAGMVKGELELLGTEQDPKALRCRQCGREYKFEDGVPNLLLADAVLPQEAAGHQKA